LTRLGDPRLRDVLKPELRRVIPMQGPRIDTPSALEG
jgi:hypothetical protein